MLRWFTARSCLRAFLFSSVLAVPFSVSVSLGSAESSDPHPADSADDASKRDDLRGWFYDSKSEIYTYVILKPGHYYEILTAYKEGEEINRRSLPPTRNDAIRKMLDEIDDETYGGATEGYEWNFSPALMRLKKALDG